VRYRFYVLHSCTLLCLVTLGTLVATRILASSGWEHQIDQSEAQRNERSTPRSFILPATPAVADEQEEQMRESKEGIDLFHCLGELRALGYGADDRPPALRARNLDALFRFQKDRGMVPTARLDRETVRLLKCQK